MAPSASSRPASIRTSISAIEEHELQPLPSSTPVSSKAPTTIQTDATGKLPDEHLEDVPLLPSHVIPLASHRKSTSSIYTYSKRRGCWHITRKHWWNSWTPEFLCSALVGFSLIAICAVLWETNGKPQPQWAMGITVNALLSLFVVLLKAGIYLPLSEGISELKWQSMRSHPRRLYEMEQYDSASRGAWGSLRFLFALDTISFYPSQVKWGELRSWKSLLQLLKPQRINVTRYLAKIAAFITVLTFIADPFAQQLIEHVDCLVESPDLPAGLPRTNYHNRTMKYSIDPKLVPELELAITIGTAFPPVNLHSLVEFQCPSGNCTFPSFQTLGLCNACEDISDQIRTNQNNNRTYKEYTLFDPRPEWGVSFLNHLTAQQPTKVFSGVPQVTVFNTSASTEILQGVFELFVLKSTDQPAAFKCTVSPCIREYRPIIANAILSERLLSTIPIPWKDGVRGEFELSTDRILREGKWENCYNLFEGKQNVDCQWHLSSMDVISDSLSNALNSQTMLLTEHPQTPYFGNIIASRLWNNGSVSLQSLDQYLNNLTEILTSSIRNTGTKNMTSLERPTPLRGKAYSRDTCIQVRSEWLTLFTTLTALTVIFWIYFVFYHRYSSTRPPWKSSSLAVLFCDVDKNIKDSIRGFQTRDEIFERSKNILVRLLPDDDGRPKFKSQ